MSGEALREAICDGDLATVKALVEEHGASVNYIDADDEWPLLLWAVKTHRSECLEYLVSKGANVHIGDAMGNTPLHKAAYLGHLDCAKILLDHGARLTARNLTQQSPMDLAEIFDRKEMIAFLNERTLAPECQQDSSE